MATHDTPDAAKVAFTAATLSARARRPADRPMPASEATLRIAGRRPDPVRAPATEERPR